VRDVDGDRLRLDKSRNNEPNIKATQWMPNKGSSTDKRFQHSLIHHDQPAQGRFQTEHIEGLGIHRYRRYEDEMKERETEGEYHTHKGARLQQIPQAVEHNRQTAENRVKKC
jgi:hypothetical protein